MTLAFTGIALGLAAAFAVTRLLTSFLSVSGRPTGLPMMVDLLATLIPARRATESIR